MAAFLSPVFGAGAQLFNNQGVVLSGGKIFTYQAGTTTPLATWTDSTQTVTNANPVILDSAGRPSTEIWLQAALTYKLILTDANNNVLGTWDNIAGLNDVSSVPSFSEWLATNLTPSYISSTSFSVTGNNTTLFAPNRRVQISVTAGVIYGYVFSSSFGGGITTVVIEPDSTAIDTGISSVNVGLLNSVNPSAPQQLLAMNAAVSVASATSTPIGAAMSANVTITGTTTITSFDVELAGDIKLVKFAGILTLTHNATSLILPDGVNIVTAAGDQAIFRSLGSGNWECLHYQTTPSRAYVPQISKSANYTTTIGDANIQILHPIADNNPRVFTIDSNANVAYAIGTTITFVNEINTLTIAITTDTMVLAFLGTVGNRSLAPNGIATALKITATKWIISGVGLS